MNPAQQRVLVAMSGGVDSSVAAALLKRQGYELVGATLQLHPCEDRGLARSCCGVDAVLAARRVADQLGIEHALIDCRGEFQEQVLRPAWQDYSRGRTPSPCILCNERIKFGLLADKARALGASKVATGHYCRIVRGPDGRPRLARGRDPGKDQAYFLFSLSEQQLEASHFPLGEMTKPEVRALAREFGLATAERVESQDACLGTSADGFAESLRLRFEDEGRPGLIVDGEGRELGRHAGLHRFTVGQRRGLGIATGQRSFVRELRDEDAAVVVTADERELWSAGLLVRLIREAALPERCEVQIRSRHRAAPARVERAGEGLARVWFDAPQRAVTPGQAAVVFDGDQVVAGGWIERAIS